MAGRKSLKTVFDVCANIGFKRRRRASASLRRSGVEGDRRGENHSSRMRATMRLPARTLLVLVLCLAALVGASAQASYFSSFFSVKGAGSGEDWEDGEDALADATRQEKEDASVDAKLRALMADAASFGADADGIRDADFEAEEDAFLEDALVDEDGGVELPVVPPAPPPLEIPPEDEDDARVEESRVEDAVGPEEARNDETEARTLDDDAADVFARMAALEAELLGLASEDDIEEEWLPAGGDGEEAPRVRAPRTLLTPRDDEDEERGTRNVQNVELLNANANVRRRALLTSSVSGDNTRWVAFEDMPARLGDSRSGPEARVARDHGEAHVTRAGGYWQAARFNRVERPSRSRLPANFGAGAGEGTLDGPRGGINQHDRVGINKASGWPGVLNAGKVSTERYPGVPTRANTQSLQPFVTSVTSYSPDARASSFAYRTKARLSKLWCVTGADSRSCADASVFATAPHDFKTGDAIFFETVYGADKQTLLDDGGSVKNYVVNAVSDDSFSFTTSPAIDSSNGALAVDVTYATASRKKKKTRANPDPPYAPRDYAYEGGDQVYFFVTFSEAVVVTGAPTLTLRTGDHFEPGAANGVARFVGGGFGEKKTFWKNDEPSPLRSRLSGGGPEDPLHVHDGGCTLGNPHNDGAGDSDCVLYSSDGQTCDCAQYSGITRSDDAQLRTRRVHPFARGDVVEVRGVVGSDAALINKRHAIGTVSGTGTTGNNLLTFEPPLNLTNRAFDASRAVVARVNGGDSCRAESAGVVGAGERAHGSGFCVFGSEADAFDERRREQFMDNTLAFALRVNTTEGWVAYENYDQAGSVDGVFGSAANPPTPHLARRLEYAGARALVVNGAAGVSIKRACVDAFQVTQVECGERVVVTVRGKHRLLPGDYVRLEGVGDAAADGVSDAFLSAWNAEHKVHALPADAGIALNRVDWNTIWDASPYWGDDVSKFQIDLNATAGRGICDARGGADGASPPSVDARSSVARKTRDANALYSSTRDSGRRCVFADADVSLPRPGDALLGVAPYAGSLSFNKDITLGRPFVVNVTARAVAGSIFGHNGGGGVPPNERLTATRNVRGPDVLRIVVSFSEPVLASCGQDDDEWATIEQSPGVRLVGCRSVRLRLKTSPDDAVAGSANYASTTGAEGEEIFPTGFMARRDDAVDKKNEIVFLYLPRRGDNCTGETLGLQYFDEFALEVGCAVSGAGGACDSRSHIRRRSDNVLASTRLPPTRRDAGRCVHGPDSNGVAQCASATADHRRSLLGTTPVFVDAVF